MISCYLRSTVLRVPCTEEEAAEENTRIAAGGTLTLKQDRKIRTRTKCERDAHVAIKTRGSSLSIAWGTLPSPFLCAPQCPACLQLPCTTVHHVPHFPGPPPSMWELLEPKIDVGTISRPTVRWALSGIKVVPAYRYLTSTSSHLKMHLHWEKSMPQAKVNSKLEARPLQTYNYNFRI